MANRSIGLDENLYGYYKTVAFRDRPELQALREETASHPRAQMQIAPEQGEIMALLIKLTGAVRALEIGVFTGYSALCVAQALPPQGKLVACDVSEEFTAIARKHWAKAGVSEKIDLRLGPAIETLAGIEQAGECFDFVFIDADKPSYDSYYESALRLVRPGGLIALDNVLWGGRLGTDDASEDSEMFRRLNRKIHGDDRVDACMLPIGDGLTLARRR